jgi:uncharacterized protein YlxP (DUF503 family)
MRKIYLSLVLACFTTILLAQKNGVVKGIAFDTISKQPVSAATITVLDKKDSSLVSFTMTGNDGKFELDVNSKAEYLISVKHLEYADLYRISKSPLKDIVLVLPSASVKVVDPTTTVTLVDDRPVIDGNIRAGAVFTLPPNALVDESGNAPSGTIRGAIATLDL